MNAQHCEVIGCTQPAAWRRITPTQTPGEDFLCERCHHKRTLESPGYTACYVVYEALPGDAAASMLAAQKYDGAQAATIMERKNRMGEQQASQAPAIKILIADDHPMTRTGLGAMIARNAGMCLVGEASDGAEAVSLYQQHRPDVVIMDMGMPVMDGLQATRAIRVEFPKARILIFSSYTGDESIYQVLRAGARGYLFKETPSTVMMDSIRSVMEGQTVLPTEVAAKLTGHMPLSDLTTREREVLNCVVDGKSNSEIGAMLFISEGTVKSHVNRILAKFKVTDRTQAALMAIKRGFTLMS